MKRGELDSLTPGKARKFSHFEYFYEPLSIFFLCVSRTQIYFSLRADEKNKTSRAIDLWVTECLYGRYQMNQKIGTHRVKIRQEAQN